MPTAEPPSTRTAPAAIATRPTELGTFMDVCLGNLPSKLSKLS
jgi:hypothetical protein